MSKIAMNSKTNLTFDSAFEKFIRKCEIKNLTANSIKSYENKIVPFRNFCDINHIEFSEIDKDTIDDFIIWVRKEHDVNDVSVNSYLRTVRAFAYFCMENGYMDNFRVHLPKADKTTKKTYSEADLDVLLKKPSVKDCDFTEFKIWAFENFLLATGVRLSTALEIQIKDIDFVAGFIFLSKMKNRKQQYIPLAKSLETVLKEYLEYRGGDNDDYLFCNSYGNKANERTYQQMVQNYNSDRGIELTSCHAFRHTFAKLSVLNGIDVFRLQKLMSHSNIAVTKEYVDLFGEDLANGYDRFNPLDNINKNNGTKIGMK